MSLPFDRLKALSEVEGLAPLHRLLAAVGRLAGRRPGLVLAGLLLVTLAAAAPAARTLRHINYNLVEVLTAGLPRAEAYKRIGQDFGIIDRHYLVVELAGPEDLPAGKELADRLAAALAADEGRAGRLAQALDGDRELADRLAAALAADQHLAGRLAVALANPAELSPRLRAAFGAECGLKGRPRANPQSEIRNAEVEDLAARLAAALAAGDGRAARLAAALPLVRSARAHLDLGGFLLEHAYLYLDEETAAELAGRFADAGLARAMDRNRRLLEAGAPRGRVEADPLDLAALLPGIARRRGGAAALVDPGGYLVSADRRTLLVEGLPTQSAGDHRFAQRLMARTDQVVRRERAAFFVGERTGLAGHVRVEIGGAYASIVQHTALMIRGLICSVASSLVVILLMFAFVYRRPSSLLFVGLPLLAPVVWTLAVAPVLLGGRLSMLGLAFAAVLLGLGIDFAVHLYNRYVAERAAGRAPAEAAAASVERTGEGIVIGALTTVAAFAGMTLTKFRGFTEFGVMAGVGVFLTMAALVLAVPSALTLLARVREPNRVAPRPCSLGLESVARAVRARPGAIVAVGLLVLAAGIGAMFTDPEHPGIRFESDFAAIGPPEQVDTSGALNRRISRDFGLAEREISVIVRGASAAEVLERTRQLRERARALARDGALGPMRSILDLVPAPGEQGRSLELAGGLALDGFAARLDRAAVAAGFRSGAFARFAGEVEKLAGRIRAGRRLDVEHLPDPMVAELAGLFFRAPGEKGVRNLLPERPFGCSAQKVPDTFFSTHSRIALPARRYGSRDYQALAASLGIDGQAVTMTSHILVAYELRDSVRGDLLLVTGVVAAVVLVMLWASLRSLILVALAMSPVLIGGAGMLLVMKAFGLSFNYINVLAFPILVGIGVDNAVHLIIRARQDGELRPAITDTGRALVLCSLTTIWGFFSLYQPLLSPPHWGMRSLGLIVAVGMSFALLVSLGFVPAALELLSRRKPAPPAVGAGTGV